jgi:glycosyltransferase involved in cell wall biosynthesis
VLAAFCSSDERYRAFVDDPSTTGVFQSIELLPDPPPTTWWGQQWHRAHLAAYFETRYRHPSYYRTIRARIKYICAREQIDCVYANLLSMAQYVDQGLSIPTVVDLTDSMTLLETRMLQSEKDIRKRVSAYLGLLRTKQLERSIGRSVDLAVTNSTVDEAVIRSLSGSSSILTIPNGVDLDYFTPLEGSMNANMILFTGVMGYAPNEDAALHFAQDVFPLIKIQQPEAEFWIVGSDPSSRLKELAQRPGIHVTGEVKDVRPFLHSAAVVVCPLRVGAGVKNKILSAMAMQKAVVATSLSIEGLDVADNGEVLLADDPKVFAEKVAHLLTHPNEAQRLGMNGYRRVQERYSWSAMGGAMEGAIRSMVETRHLLARQG